MNAANEGKIAWIQTGKGLGILLVVLGHVIRDEAKTLYPLLNFVYTNIYSFHMALFFFLAGVTCMLSRKNRSGKEAALHYVKQYMVPWLVYSLAVYAIRGGAYLTGVVESLLAGTQYEMVGFGRYLQLMFAADNPFCFHTWFIYVLFLCQMLVLVLSKLRVWVSMRDQTYHLAVLGISVLMILCSLGGDALLFRLFRQNFFFFAAGMVYSQYRNRIPAKRTVALCGVCAIVSSSVYTLAKMGAIAIPGYTAAVQQYSQLFVSAPLMIFFLIGVLKHLKQAKILAYLGSNSFNIYLLHQPACAIAATVMLKVLGLSWLSVSIQMIFCFAFSLGFPLVAGKLIHILKLDDLFKKLLGIKYVAFG